MKNPPGLLVNENAKGDIVSTSAAIAKLHDRRKYFTTVDLPSIA
jgi:hypothetical protein